MYEPLFAALARVSEQLVDDFNILNLANMARVCTSACKLDVLLYVALARL